MTASRLVSMVRFVTPAPPRADHIQQQAKVGSFGLCHNKTCWIHGGSGLKISPYCTRAAFVQSALHGHDRLVCTRRHRWHGLLEWTKHWSRQKAVDSNPKELYSRSNFAPDRNVPHSPPKRWVSLIASRMKHTAVMTHCISKRYERRRYSDTKPLRSNGIISLLLFLLLHCNKLIKAAYTSNLYGPRFQSTSWLNIKLSASYAYLLTTTTGITAALRWISSEDDQEQTRYVSAPT